MSADAFERTMAELNPSGTAFTEQLQAAQRELARLAAIERELKRDDARLGEKLAALRHGLEATTKSLTAAHERRARLVKELAACDDDVATLEAQKADASAKM